MNHFTLHQQKLFLGRIIDVPNEYYNYIKMINYGNNYFEGEHTELINRLELRQVSSKHFIGTVFILNSTQQLRFISMLQIKAMTFAMYLKKVKNISSV